MYVCIYICIYVCMYVCMYLLPFPREGTAFRTQTLSNTSPEINHIMFSNNDNNM